MIPLEAQTLTCGYGPRQVLQDLSLAVRAGEVLGLLGANGAGKTTLLRALARLLRPTRGEVLLHERSLWAYRPIEAAQRIALMPQSENRDWPLTVEQAVGLGRLPHRSWWMRLSEHDRQCIDSALTSTGMQALRDRPITQLSGGEWRRMILARALAQEASILLLDEPTAGLDLRFQHQALRLIQQLAADRGLAVVIALHDFNHAALYADRLAVLARHSIVALGTPREVLAADVIQLAFGIPVSILQHPVYGTPLVVPLNNESDALRGGGA